MEFFVALATQPTHFSKDELSRPWEDAAHLINSCFLLAHHHMGVRRPLHSIGLACSSLTIGKDAHILTIDCRLNKGFHLLKDIFLAG